MRGRGRGRFVHFSIAILAAGALFPVGDGAFAQNSAERMADAASGFGIAPPRGYVAQRDTPVSTSEVAISVTRVDEDDTRCRLSFEAIPGFSQFTQDELNREADRPNFDAFYRDSVGAFYTVAAVDHFDRPGLRGAMLRATSRAKPATLGWRAGLAALIFMFYTPKGLAKVICTAAEAVFEARRRDFEAVANAVTLPR
jgi:hypothetical protein